MAQPMGGECHLLKRRLSIIGKLSETTVVGCPSLFLSAGKKRTSKRVVQGPFTDSESIPLCPQVDFGTSNMAPVGGTWKLNSLLNGLSVAMLVGGRVFVFPANPERAICLMSFQQTERGCAFCVFRTCQTPSVTVAQVHPGRNFDWRRGVRTARCENKSSHQTKLIHCPV